MRLPTLLILSALLTSPAWAQPMDEPPTGEDEPPKDERDRVMERVRIMRMYALTEALDLDEATAARLFPYLRTGDQTIEALHDKKRGFKEQLREMAKSGVYDDAGVAEAIRGLSELDVAIAQERAKQVQGLKGVLNAEQQVKFLLVRARFEGQVRDMIRQDRRQRGRRGGPPEEAGHRSRGSAP